MGVRVVVLAAKEPSVAQIRGKGAQRVEIALASGEVVDVRREDTDQAGLVDPGVRPVEDSGAASAAIVRRCGLFVIPRSMSLMARTLTPAQGGVRHDRITPSRPAGST
ncbi:hypothetical protein LCL61_17790 [Amycolatopsis coloradensis]|uniref:Uncharacterized protein n=1 Tax=Amycolatopsis coloradensis TaxID=76021 RepID=A0ACD5BD84_9PSEU